MKYLLTTVLIIETFILNAQYKIAVFTPSNKTTRICPTLDSAYNSAGNGDYIYLPGGSFSLAKQISKEVHIVGAGYFADSSQVTNITSVTDITLVTGSSSSSFEGLYINGQVQFGFIDASDGQLDNIIFQRCYLTKGILFLSTGGHNLSNNISIIGCIYSFQDNPNQAGPTGFVLVSNCLIPRKLNSFDQSQIQNSIFLFHDQFDLALVGINCSNSIFKNNIYFQNFYMVGVNNNFYNNIGLWNNGNYTGSNAQNAYGINNLTETWGNTFINSDSNTPFNYPTDNFHLKINSIGKNAGTDGTDIGIYGGLYPWKDGSIPSNPHISLLKVDTKTNANGILNATFQVTPQNN